MHQRTTHDVQSGMGSKKSLQGMDQLFKTKGHHKDVPTKAKNAATGLATHCKERMYIVDSGASLRMKGLSSLNHREKTIRQSSTILDIQAATGIEVSDTRGKVYIKGLGAHLCTHVVKDSPSVPSLGRPSTNLVILIRGRQEKLPDYQKGKNVIECNIEHFVPMVAVTKQKAVPSIESGTAK